MTVPNELNKCFIKRNSKIFSYPIPRRPSGAIYLRSFCMIIEKSIGMRRTDRGQLITATRFSINHRDEFKRGREYPLLVVSESVIARCVNTLCVRGLTDTISQEEIPRVGEKEETTGRCPVNRVGADEADRSREETPKTAVLHLSIRTEQMAKFNAKPDGLFANENHARAKQELPLVSPLVVHSRRGAKLFVDLFPSYSLSFRLNYDASVNLRDGCLLKLIARHAMRRE